MVANITSLTGNGLKDWLIQRVSALYLAAYSLFLLGFLLLHPHLDYTQWHTLFMHLGFKIATVLCFFLISLHAWIGIWTVTTDYIKCTVVRLSVQLAVALGLFAQVIWGIMIAWGQ